MVTRDSALFVTGRLIKIAPPEERKGHRLRARSGGRLLDSTMTDETGKFLLEWADDNADGNILIELLDSKGLVTESLELTRADLDSPPVLTFTGEGMVGSGGIPRSRDWSDRFEADGSSPIHIAPSCQEVTLSWTSSEGSTVSILADGEDLWGELPKVGSLKVAESGSHTYTRRTWLAGGGPDKFSDRTVEIRRYPSLSLVVPGEALRAAGRGDFGASTSCPAGSEGLEVKVKSSDQEMIPDFELVIQPRLAWATTSVPIGSMKGVVTLTASAPGFPLDAVTFSL